MVFIHWGGYIHCNTGVRRAEGGGDCRHAADVGGKRLCRGGGWGVGV